MTGNQDRFQKAMNQGHSAAWDQSWGEASAYYRQALEEFPENPKALTSLGLALVECSDLKGAFNCYHKAAKASPDDPLPIEKVAELSERLGNLKLAPEAYLRAAELYAKNKDLQKALENWQRVTIINPSHLLARSRLALVYERTGRKTEAVAEYLVITALHQKQGNLAKAVETITHALQVQPESKDIMRAMQQLKSGQPLPLPSQPTGLPGLPAGKQSLPMLKPPSKPENTDDVQKGSDPIQEASQKALSALASLLFDQETEEDDLASTTSGRRGLDALLRGVGASDSKQIDQTKILLHLAQMIDHQGQHKTTESIEELERAIQAGLDHPAAHYSLGCLLYESGQLENAQQHVRRALSNPDYALGAHLISAQIYENFSESGMASLAYLEALRLADSMVVESTQSDELQQLYEPLIEEHTQNADEKVQQGLCLNVKELLLRPDWRQYLQIARQQLPRDEGGPPVPLAEILTEARGSRLVDAISRIRQYARLGYLRSAMEEAYQALQHAPTYLPLHTYIGELLVQQDRTQNAIEKFSVVAHSYSVRGDSKRSVDLYRRILALSPMYMHARDQLITLLNNLGRMDEALNEYLSLAEVYYNMADLDMSRSTYSQALLLTRQANVDSTWKSKILHRMADLDLQGMDWRQALKAYEQIRNVQPDDETARSSLIELNLRLGQSVQAFAELDNYISYLWSNGLRKQAIRFVESLLDHHDQQAAIRKRLAELFRQVGRIEDAISQLDAAAELLVDIGDRAGAVDAIRMILALNPPNAADYHKALANLKGA
jgi:tetratricopeptide (TPR) repeat protein